MNLRTKKHKAAFLICRKGYFLGAPGPKNPFGF